jgi:hypothetical protein
MSSPIFVAGTGRSGTTALATIIGQHPSVWGLQHESRFLIDPGGLQDLVRALTVGYTPFHAEDAIRRLRALLTERLAGAQEGAFASWALPAELGPGYGDWVERFLAALTWYSFLEGGAPDRQHVGRYFPDRAQLTALCASFVDELFSTPAQGRIWCEKTPLNLLSMDFLWELFPAARIVHVMRHPEAIVASHLDQPWAPDTVDSICSWLEPIYRRWLDFRPTIDTPAYIELRLEDLAADWPRQRAELFDRLDLPDAQTPTAMDSGRVRHLGSQLSDVDIQLIRSRLGFAIEALGYS